MDAEIQFNETLFRWPTAKDLKGICQDEPLKLKEIITKAAEGNPLSAIQLVFENGIKSPMFDAKCGGANDEMSVSVLDKTMVCITAQVESIYISKIQFEYKDGEAKVVFDKNFGYGT